MKHATSQMQLAILEGKRWLWTDDPGEQPDLLPSFLEEIPPSFFYTPTLLCPFLSFLSLGEIYLSTLQSYFLCRQFVLHNLFSSVEYATGTRTTNKSFRGKKFISLRAR